MSKASIRVEKLVIPTYPTPVVEEMPIFSEHRVHQRSSGRPYPNKPALELERSYKEDKEYTAVHLENDFLDVWILPEIGGRIFAAQDKTTGYDFFYRQHVIKPALIGALGSWISGGVEFNWPYHHRASGFLPCDYTIEECEDGSVICWLSEHDPVDRMKGMVGIVLRKDATYIETRMRLCNRTPITKSFLWWENAAVPVNESYQIFFPHDVTYVNFHYLDSRISYPLAGAATFNGIDMAQARDISMHKNTKEATSYFACASKYDFFGGYDHGKECGVVHIADHHISPGKKMFTWGYNQLSKSWENALTDTDGQYAELMAGSYSDNQPNFSWLEPYETKEFSEFWYPISKIGTPDFANLDCALKLAEDHIAIQVTRPCGKCTITVKQGAEVLLSEEMQLHPAVPVCLDWAKPAGLVSIEITAADGDVVAKYVEEIPDDLKMPPVKDPMPLAAEVSSADELYRAGVHVEQYRDPAVMPDAYWLEALKRDPYHAPSLLGMAKYSYQMMDLEEARNYVERAIAVLTKFNTRLENGDAYYLHGLILEALGETDEAYDEYYKAFWNGSAIAKAMARVACIDLKRGDYKAALVHAEKALVRDADHPLAPAVMALAFKHLGKEDMAQQVISAALARDPMNLLVRFLSDMERSRFYGQMHSDPAQSCLDLVGDLESMGEVALTVDLLEGLVAHRPECGYTMIHFTLARLHQEMGLESTADIAAGEVAALGNTYPVRLEEAKTLRFVMEQGSVRAIFLLGCLLYDKRHYAEGAKLFETAFVRVPDDYMACRSLAVACFSHLDRIDMALPLMKQAMGIHPTAQLLYETVLLMNKLDVAPQEKIDMMVAYPQFLFRDDLLTELAKAYNQNGQPEKALEVLMGHDFIPCEGGEHAIADQYMFAWYQLGMGKLDDPAAAMDAFTMALTLPQNLGAGIWNRCKYVPYQFRIAECLEALNRADEAANIYKMILGIEVEFFSNMHLRELPWYQAMSARKLGNLPLANKLMGKAKREWLSAVNKKDNGYFATTPFFISFTDNAAQLRRAQYLYLLALVSDYEGEQDQAKAQFREAAHLNSDLMFCGFFAR